MPEISRFYGIIIRMFFDDHAPPHFHACYGDDQIIIDINSLAVIAGRFPPRALGLTMEWAAQHHGELKTIWSKAQNGEPLDKIAPLP